MIPTRWKKVLADLWEYKSRTVWVIASIFIGVFAVGIIAVGYVVLPRGMRATYIGAEPANIEIACSAFDEAMIESVARLEGVGAVDGQRAFTVQARPLGAQAWQDLEIVALAHFADRGLKRLTPAAGVFLPDEAELTLLVETLDDLGLSIGQSLEVELQDGAQRMMPVVGTVNDYTLGLASAFNLNRAYISGDHLAYLHEDETYDTLYLTVSEGGDDSDAIQAVAVRVRDHLERAGMTVYSVQTSLRSEHPYGSYIQAVIGILAFLGVLTVLLSASLIANTMNALMAQQIRHIGVMKLIGARRSQIIAMYLALVLILGLISLLAAIPSAAVAGYGIAAMVANVLNGALIESTWIPIIPSVVILQTLVALLGPVAAALVPVLRGSRITVQTALSGNLRRGAPSQGWIERLIMRARGKDGVRLLAFRNTFRNQKRLLITLLTFALGGAIFIAVFNVQGSLDQQIERVVGYSSADVYLDLRRAYPISEITERLMSISGVAQVEAWKTASGKITMADGAEVAVILLAPPDGTQQVTPVTSQGRWVMEQDDYALVVNDAFWYSFPDLQPGDRLSMEIRGKSYDWHVVGIYNYSGIDRKMAYTNYATLSSILHDTTHATSFRIVTEAHDSAFQNAMVQSIDALLGRQGYSISSVTARNDIVEEPVEKLNIVTQVLMVLAILIGLVGSIGLSSTLRLNVMERTSEIGILRAIGAHNRIITRLVIIEGLIIGMVSYLLGVVLSFPITRLLGDVVNLAIFHARGEFVLTGMGFSLWLLVVFVLSILASVTPARNAKQLTIREVLAYE